jgi:hypothetical protein
MKKLLKMKNLYAIFFIQAVCLLYACSEKIQYDITGNSTNKVYVNTETSYVNNYKLSVVHTPISEVGNITVTFPVRCTHEAATDLTVTFAADNSLIDAYNSANSTTYLVVPDGLIVLSNNGLTIPKGAIASSDSLTISIPNNMLSQLTSSGYVIPIRISGISSTSNTVISSNQSIVYVVITTSWSNCYDNTLIGDMVGTLITPRTSWSATLDATLVSGTLPQMFDGSTTTYWRISPSAFTMIVNLATQYTGITGIRTNSNTTSYDLTQVRVSSSTDGTTWVYQGIPLLSRANAYQYIKFYSPITAKYLKIEAVTWYSTSRIYMAEFDVYKN